MTTPRPTPKLAGRYFALAGIENPQELLQLSTTQPKSVDDVLRQYIFPKIDQKLTRLPEGPEGSDAQAQANIQRPLLEEARTVLTDPNRLKAYMNICNQAVQTAIGMQNNYQLTEKTSLNQIKNLYNQFAQTQLKGLQSSSSFLIENGYSSEVTGNQFNGTFPNQNEENKFIDSLAKKKLITPTPKPQPALNKDEEEKEKKENKPLRPRLGGDNE